MFDPATDPVVQALIAEAAADPDVIGIVMTGSRAIGAVTPESDYDFEYVVTDEAAERYAASGSQPIRGAGIPQPAPKLDIWHEARTNLMIETVPEWTQATFADSRVVYDRTGELTALIEALRRMPAERASELAAQNYDGYLNQLLRSLKCWRRGNQLGGRLEAAHSVEPVLRALFACERHWRPFSSRLHLHIHELEGQGWRPGELEAILIDLISSGDPRRQQEYARRIIALMAGRGYGSVYDDWDGQIDAALGWTFV